MIELNKIYNGDCTEVLKTFPDNFVDLVVTSPPYNCGIKYDSYEDRIDLDQYYTWSKEWMSQIFRVLKRDGRCCINHYLSMGDSQKRHAPLMTLNEIAVKEIGFKHHGLALWMDKTLSNKTAWGSWLSASAPYVSSPIEGILILYKEVWKKEKVGGVSDISKEDFIMGCRGMWDFATDRKRLTMATFPEELPKLCIQLFSYVGDLVLDPFSGSGTTATVAKRIYRDYIGIELSPNYAKIGESRAKQVMI